MRIAVIGSGPTGTACAKALVGRGLKPVVIDVGQLLPPERQALVERMAASEPERWSDPDRESITSNPTVQRGRVPKKTVFGTDYYVARDSVYNPIRVHGDVPTGSFAKGGLSTAWGAAVLPAHNSDMEDWPIRQADLAASYRRVLSTMPLSAARDDLEAAFPLFRDDIAPLALPQQAQAALRDFVGVSAHGPAAFLCGQARLAVDLNGCRYCGLCLSGCVYGAIYSAGAEIDALSRCGAIEYRPGHMVETFLEKPSGVQLRVRHFASGEIHDEHFDTVFLAAGAVQSTRIVLHSLGLFDHPVSMKDSQKYILPLLRCGRTPLEWPNVNSLSSLFLEFKVPEISNHWFHVQVSTMNDLALQGIGIAPWRGGLRRRLLAPLFERMLIAWGGLHSSLSSSIRVTLLNKHRPDGAPILELRPQPNRAAPRAARQAAKHLARMAWRAGRTVALTPALIVGGPGGGNHFGGTLPMRAQPRHGLETDVLGRLPGHQRVHVVDGSILPSIPATTIALLQMANADRIANAVQWA